LLQRERKVTASVDACAVGAMADCYYESSCTQNDGTTETWTGTTNLLISFNVHYVHTWQR